MITTKGIFKSFAGKTVLLGANIALTSAFTPIGQYEGNAFKGTFDGAGYTVSGLSIEGGSTARYQALFAPFREAISWEELVGFTLASTPAERTVVLSGTSFRIVPRRYASGQLICDRITDSGSRLRDQRLSLDKMEIADMYAIVRETPVDERTRGALESRALLTLREGTPDEFRHLVKRYPARLSALEPFLEAHRMER